MIFGLLMLAVVGVVAFFHYTQGFFSAFISAVLAAIAAVVAIGFHEQVVAALNQGRTADYAHAGVICALYAGSYIILRVIFDTAIPGNVNFGSLPDKIGAGVMGLFAGLFTAGVVAIAAQTLPFGPVMGGYAKWEASTNRIQLNAIPMWARVGRSDITDFLYANDELKDPYLDPSKVSGLILPVDDFVLSFTSMVSAGSLSGDTQWRTINPAYTEQLFAQRLGIQPGAKITAFEMNKRSQVEVMDIFRGRQKYDQIDGDIKEFRTGKDTPAANLTPAEGQFLVVARLKFARDAAEKDGKVRFGLGNIRLVAGGKNYFPVAVLRDDTTAIFQRADDFLIVDGDRGIDAVFSVDESFFKDGKTDDAEMKVADGVFVEFKRLSRTGIGGKDIKPNSAYSVNEATSNSILRRQGWLKPQQH